jgi:drug/metabolite transporter (DMT)-like permease
MNVSRLSMVVHVIVVTMLFAIAGLVVSDALKPPAPDDPNADWHWLDLWVSGFMALAILGYMVFLGLAVWLATGRRNWVPIAITMDLGAAFLAGLAALTWNEGGIDPKLILTAFAAITGAILVARSPGRGEAYG